VSAEPSWDTQADWESTTVATVRAGDRVRLPSGVELLVSRVDERFFGNPDLVKLVESTERRWLAQAAPTSLEVQVIRGVGPGG
jgi:hypothetical protein